jgi:hypothetical protein
MTMEVIDSGLTPENLEAAELLWANLPVQRKFRDLATYDQVLVCHTVARVRAQALAAQSAEMAKVTAERDALREALKELVPDNLGFLPANMPDETILPVDVTFGEIRRARAALSQEPHP